MDMLETLRFGAKLEEIIEGSYSCDMIAVAFLERLAAAGYTITPIVGHVAATPEPAPETPVRRRGRKPKDAATVEAPTEQLDPEPEIKTARWNAEKMISYVQACKAAGDLITLGKMPYFQEMAADLQNMSPDLWATVEEAARKRKEELA